MSTCLGIHIIGQGFGESVVLEMPNGAIGVIDCFAPQLKATTRTDRLQANPTLRYLIEGLNAERLAFVAFSHPHEDHGRGLSHVLEEFRGRIDEIWMFRAFQSIHLERHVKALINGRRRLDIETLLDEPVGTFSDELSKITELVLTLTNRRNAVKTAFRDFAGYRQFRVKGEPLTFHVIGPTDQLVAEYERSLIENMVGLVDDTGEHVNPEWKPDRVNHNCVCAALVVEFGKTRVVIGADMETDAWEAVIEEIDSPAEYDLTLGCHLVKVSHHGSTTGHCEGLYEQRFCRRGGKKPIAILTPFNRHRNPLPNAAGVDHLLANARLLFSTNITEAHHACGRNPPGYVPFPEGEGRVAIPLNWARDLMANPALLGALVPSESEGAHVHPSPVEVPFTWQSDLIANPRLARLLQPEVRRVLITEKELRSAVTESDCRVSFYFNDKGMELTSRRYLGSLAGQIGTQEETASDEARGSRES